jgi:hypothetical protein
VNYYTFPVTVLVLMTVIIPEKRGYIVGKHSIFLVQK